MIQYLYSIPILIATLLCMLFLAITNEYLLPAHKKGFLVVFSGAIFTAVCEVFSLLLNGSDPAFKLPHFLSNYFGFLLTPILILFFASSIGRFHRLKGAAIGIAAYFILCNVLVATKQLFFIDSQNHYHRGALFNLYVISYFLSILYLLYESLRYSRKGFLHHKVFAWLLSCCFLFSCSIQVFKSEIYITRITVVLSLCAYYAYNTEFTNLFDKLTGLLNQGTYLKKIKDLREHQTVIILDIDDFKQINDRYGHQTGDDCLASVSRAIKSVFGHYGQCYRIGGDEFAVVLRKNVNITNLITRFERKIEEKFKDSSYPISVAIGYSKREKKDSYEDVIRRADSNMYADKSRRKAPKATRLVKP